MKKILYDTNMFAYWLDNKVLDPKVERLTRMIFDSEDIRILIHPKTLEEAKKIKDQIQKEIFLSKLRVYRQIENPPKPTQNFKECFRIKSDNDEVDCELLYSVKQNCVDYFITNDLVLIKKANKLGLSTQVLSVDDALELFKNDDKKDYIDTPIFINEEYLTNIEVEDNFLDSLRLDYKGFNKWFITKQKEERTAFVVREKDNVSALLMLKEESESEFDNNLDMQLPKGKRLKVCTFKVQQQGKRIGESFIKLIFEKAIKIKVDYIYVTVFDKYDRLIDLLKEYGFEYYTDKKTENFKNEVCIEKVFIRRLSNKDIYPYINYTNQKIYLIPIKPRFNKLLFPEYEKNTQISIEDYTGDITVANAIRKAYICHSSIRKIKEKDIIVFYRNGRI